MKKFIQISLLVIALLSLSACTLGTTSTTQAAVAFTPGLTLTIQAQNAPGPFNTVGQTVSFIFTVSNPGQDPLSGPVTINSDKVPAVCPTLNIIGDLDDVLDPGESITCPASYALTQADLDAGKVMTNAMASAGGISSTPTSSTIQTLSNRILNLAVTASLASYNQAGQTITYSFVIRNNGSIVLAGPFSISDNKVTAICATPVNGQLAPNEQMNCTATYLVTQADIAANSVVNVSTASGGGAVSNNITTTVPYSGAVPTTIPPGNLVKGTTIQHEVKQGEWLVQIARCYGASYDLLRRTNPQIVNPRLIKPGLIVSVPNIGSAGTIYGPPCVVTHTVVNGETWNTIASLYNASPRILQEANPGALSAGRVLKVPKNSAGANPVPLATLTPVPPTISYFTTSANSVQVGATITLSWSYSGQSITQARLTRTNPDGSQSPLYNGADVPSVSTYQELMNVAGTYTYTLTVSTQSSGTAMKYVAVIVNP